MKLDDLVAGLLTLRKYYTTDGYHTGAEHDTFYAYATDQPVSEADVKKLADLGWFQEIDGLDEWSPETYDPSESWAAYV